VKSLEIRVYALLFQDLKIKILIVNNLNRWDNFNMKKMMLKNAVMISN